MIRVAQFGLASGLMARTIGWSIPSAGFFVVARSVIPVTVAAAGLPGALTTGQAAPRALTTGQAVRAWLAWPAPRTRQCCYTVSLPCTRCGNGSSRSLGYGPSGSMGP